MRTKNWTALRRSLIALCGLLVVGSGLLACCPKRQTLQVTTVAEGCVKEPPPSREAVVISVDIPESCPAELVCYTEEEHRSVELAMAALKKVERWASLTWIACKTAGAEGETP
jgi:hypothetical protein